MKTQVFLSAKSSNHEPPEGHPEHAGRYDAALAGIKASGVELQFSPRLANRAALERVHVPAMIEAIYASAPAQGEVALDADTWMSPGSLDAALNAAGAALDAVDAVMSGQCEAAFVAARPPGHHAEPDRAMGFCLFNSIAIAAMHALANHNLQRASIVDFDVHHGNGSQAFVESEPRLSFASIHQGWIYPGTGAAYETGQLGNIVNIPVAAGTTGGDWLDAIRTRILKQLETWSPELILVSAGFDGHKADPLAGLALTEADFAEVGRVLAQAAKRHSQSRLVCVLEGGYDCPALERSVGAFLEALEAS